MTLPERSRLARPVLLACVVVVLGSASLGAGPATAAPPLPLAGPEAGVVPPVPAAAPVEEVVGKVAGTVPPPARQAVQAVTPTVGRAARGQTPKVSTPPVAVPGAPAASRPDATTGAAVHRAEETGAAAAKVAETVVGTARSTAATATSPPTAEPEGTEITPGTGATSPPPPGPADSDALPTDRFEPAPARNGSTSAPVPRWVAYVWPAVALTGPFVAGLTRRMEAAASRLAAAGSGRPAEGQGVAGAHASGGTSERSGSSSPFAKIPAAVGGAFYSSATMALVYLSLATLVVIAVAVAVRREILIGRRERG